VKVMIVDKSAPGFRLLGRMDAAAGMRSTAGNEIVKVGSDSCTVMIEGRPQRRAEVTIDIKTALEFGWTNGSGNGASAREPAAAAPPAPRRRPKSPAAGDAAHAKFKSKFSAAEWREMAGAAVAHGYSTANYMFGGAKLTPARRRDWTARLKSAHERLTVGRTMERIAGAVERRELPEILRGVGKLGVGWLVEAWLEPDGYRARTVPAQMGPIKTAEQFRAAVEALTPLIARLPVLSPDRCATCGHYVASCGGELLPHRKSNGAAGERWAADEFCGGKRGACGEAVLVPEEGAKAEAGSKARRGAGK
jgi:hypothetical protein